MGIKVIIKPIKKGEKMTIPVKSSWVQTEAIEDCFVFSLNSAEKIAGGVILTVSQLKKMLRELYGKNRG